MAAALLCFAATGTNLLHAETTVDVEQQAMLNSSLLGKFAFSAWRACVQSKYPNVPGFDPISHAQLIDAESTSFSESGIVRFNGKGTLKIVDAQVISVGAPAVNSVPVMAGLRSSCTGTYAVHPNRSLDMVMSCSAQVPGNMTMTMGPFHYAGYIDLLNKTVTMSESDGTIQAIALSPTGSSTPLYTFERICASSGTLMQTGK